MRLIPVIAALAAPCLASAPRAAAQTEASKVIRLGVLSDLEPFGNPISPTPPDWLASFRAGSRHSGFEEGLLKAAYPADSVYQGPRADNTADAWKRTVDFLDANLKPDGNGVTKRSEENANNSEAHQDILEVDHEWNEARLRSDTTTLHHLLADDWTLTHADGRVETKAQYIADFNSGARKFESYTEDDVRVRIHENTAVVTCLAVTKGQYRGQVTGGKLRHTRVWVTIQGRWQMVVALANGSVVEESNRATEYNNAAQEVMQAEKERAQAVLRNDGAAMDRLLGEEFTVTDVQGIVHGRLDELSLYKDKRRQTQSWEPSDVKVRLYGDAAIVTERATVKDILEGEQRDIQIRLTHVWVKRDGRWQVVARQATRISEPPSAAASVASRQTWTAPAISSTEPSSAAELPSKSKAEQEVRQAERELTEALSQGNFATVERIYADDYSLTTVDGELQNKAQRIAALRATDPRSIARNRDDFNVRVYGKTAVVIGHTLFSTQVRDSSHSENRRFTHVFVQRQGRWQMVASQVTRIRGEATSQQDRTSENEAQARRVIDAFNAAGNRRDVEGLRNALNFPFVRIAGGKVSIARTREEFASDAPPQWREEGWHHSTVDSVEFIQSSSDKVHAAVVFSRYKADGTRYATYRTLRIITKQDGHWGIQCSSSFAP